METKKKFKFIKQFQNWFFKICNKEWFVIDSESHGNYLHENPIKFLTNSIESRLCYYSDAYILVIGDIVVKNANNANLAAAARVAFKNFAPSKNCTSEINYTFVDEADYINIAIPMYNFSEHSDNYSYLWQFKRDEIVNNANVTVANSSSFKYKSNFVGNADNNGDLTGAKIAVPLNI